MRAGQSYCWQSGFGLGFIFQGVAESALAISNRELPERGWHIFFGVVSIIAGMIVIAWPFDSIVLLAIVVGVSLVVIAIRTDRLGVAGAQGNQFGRARF